MVERVSQGDLRGHWTEESKRLASFFTMSQDFPRVRVWFIRLAAAGFYHPHGGSSFVSCAFCHISIDLTRFQDTVPADLHRKESPRCPLLTGPGPGAWAGRGAPNVSFQQQGQETALRLISILFGATGKGSTPSRQASAGQRHQPLSPESSSAHQLPQSSPQAQPQPQPQPQPQSALAPPSQQLQSVSTSSPQQCQSHATANPPQPQPLPASSPQAISRVSAGQRPADRSDRSACSLPSIPTASPPLAARVDTDSSHSLEEPGLPRQSEIPVSHAGRELPRPEPSSQLIGTQTTSGSLPYQTAQPASQHHDGRSSSSASGQNGASEAASTLSSPPPAGETSRQLVTYRQLGIYTELPQRPDMSICSLRVDTYSNTDHLWPHLDTHTPQDMAKAGFYYVGLEDLVRCFYCKGGLKAWDEDLGPWVEHARNFPQCPFVGQVKGQEFIDVVQALLRTLGESFSTMEVEEEVQRRNRESRANADEASVAYSEGTVGGGDGVKFGAVSGGDGVMFGAVGGGDGVMFGAVGGAEDLDDIAAFTKLVEELEDENKDLNDARLCKICQEDNVSILFLPCGHLVSCAQCSPALRMCAMCRHPVKGRVRVTHTDTD